MNDLSGYQQGLKKEPQSEERKGFDAKGVPSIIFISGAMHTGFSYSHMYFAEFKRDIVITFTDHVVTVSGENLHELFMGIMRHVRGIVQETLEGRKPEDGAMVRRITIEQREA